MQEDWLTVKEAAQLAGVTEAAIWKAVSRGQLASVKPLRDVFIPRAEFTRWLTTRRPPGRPRKAPMP